MRKTRTSDQDQGNISSTGIHNGILTETLRPIRKSPEFSPSPNTKDTIPKIALSTFWISRLVLTAIILISLTHFISQALYESNPGAFPFDGAFIITDLDQEQSFGTFTSTLLFTLSAILFAFRALASPVKRQKIILFAFSALLFVMALDESISFHERTMNIIDTFTDFGPGSFFRFQWLLFGLPLAIFLVGGVIYLARTTRLHLKPFLIGLFVFFCGAVGLEGLGGVLDPNHFNYHVWMTGAEETVELIGVYLIFVSQLKWFKNKGPVTLSMSK